jgi:hypothetical protein
LLYINARGILFAKPILIHGNGLGIKNSRNDNEAANDEKNIR